MGLIQRPGGRPKISMRSLPSSGLSSLSMASSDLTSPTPSRRLSQAAPAPPPPPAAAPASRPPHPLAGVLGPYPPHAVAQALPGRHGDLVPLRGAAGYVRA